MCFVFFLFFAEALSGSAGRQFACPRKASSENKKKAKNTKKIRDSFGIDQEVYIAELNWDLLTEMSYANPLRYEEVPKFPLVRRDFALLLDDSISFEKLRLSALKTDCKILKEINLFDVYEGKNIEKGKKSYGLSFIFLDKNKTLTDKQVDKVMNKLQNNFEKDFGAQLR